MNERTARTRHTRRHKPFGPDAATLIARYAPAPAVVELAPATRPLILPGLRPVVVGTWATDRAVPLGGVA